MSQLALIVPDKEDFPKMADEVPVPKCQLSFHSTADSIVFVSLKL